MEIKRMKFVCASLFCFIVGFFSTVQVYAQGDMDQLLRNGVVDGKYLLTGYLDPFMKSISQGLNQGWYNTAKTHKVAGLDLTVTMSPMYIPNSGFTYYVDNTKLTSIELLDGPGGNPKSGYVPTMLGPDKAPTYRDKTTLTEFQGPAGVDLKKNVGKYLPVPMATFGFGLPLGIELRFRYSPKIDLGDKSTFNLFGVGVKHDIKQYIPGIKRFPFDLSAFVGYTHMEMDADLSGNFKDESGSMNSKNQKGVFSVNSTTIQGVISKKVSVLTVYGSLGYNIAKSSLAMKGSYDFDNSSTISASEKNPVNLSFAASGPRVSAGVRLKLAVFTFHADYTLQKYKSLSVGFGINIR